MSAQPGGRLAAAKDEAVRRALVGPGLDQAELSLAWARRRSQAVDPLVATSGNVVGVGLGDKVAGGHALGQIAVKIYVRRKKPLDEVPDAERIPPYVGGVPTDVEEVGVVRALSDCTRARRQHVRPVPGGFSIGHGRVSAGILGALVRDSGRVDNGRRYVLSNNHVLADANEATIGDTIFQPGPLDGGRRPEHAIGRLSRLVRLDFGGGLNAVDAAVAEVEPGSVLAEVCAVGTPSRTIQPQRGMDALKHGRTTGLTRGLITDVDADFKVDVGGRMTFFTGAIVIRGAPPTVPFSQPGDSGALICTSDRRACGLLFAGSPATDVTLANPIREVFRRLKVRLAPAD